ncbi:MAG: hypothetical protein AB7U98_06985 [Candidatus Nitrosocosmicus sp.]
MTLYALRKTIVISTVILGSIYLSWIIYPQLLSSFTDNETFKDDLFYMGFAQVSNNGTVSSTIDNSTWISERDNLKITMELEPEVPIIDQWTRIHFEIKNMTSDMFFLEDGLFVNATFTDHDGRLFKFPQKSIIDGKFNLEYIFPDDGQHRIILQLYKNNIAFTVAFFDLTVPHPQLPKDFWSQLFQPRPY